MKLITFTMIMFFAASIAAKAFDYETSKLEQENEQAENNFNLMDFLQFPY